MHQGNCDKVNNYRSVSRRLVSCWRTSRHTSALCCNSSCMLLSSNDWLCPTMHCTAGSTEAAANDCSISTRSLSFCRFNLQHTHTHTQPGQLSLLSLHGLLSLKTHHICWTPWWLARWSDGWVLDLWLRGRGFESRSGRYQVVTTGMSDCLWTGI